jgi:hypothetical protein
VQIYYFFLSTHEDIPQPPTDSWIDYRLLTEIDVLRVVVPKEIYPVGRGECLFCGDSNRRAGIYNIGFAILMQVAVVSSGI